jgi:hypothetical protein
MGKGGRKSPAENNPVMVHIDETGLFVFRERSSDPPHHLAREIATVG